MLVLGMIRTFRTKFKSPSPMWKVIFFLMKLRILWRSGSILALCAKGSWLESGERREIFLGSHFFDVILHQFF